MGPNSLKLGAILQEVVFPVLFHPKQGSQQGDRVVPVMYLFIVFYQPDYVGISTQTSICNGLIF